MKTILLGLGFVLFNLSRVLALDLPGEMPVFLESIKITTTSKRPVSTKKVTAIHL